MLTIAFVIGGIPAKTAAAETGGGYACILSEDVYFYTAETEYSGIFTLPKTYYVKVLSIGERFTQVEYLTDTEHTKTLRGYCLTEQLTFVDYTPLNPYLYATFDVIYTPEGGETGDQLLEKLTLTCGYYGDYSIGSKRYAYVLQNGEYAYVPRPDRFSYVENPEYENRITDPTPEEGTSAVNPVQIGVLAVLCLLVPLLSAIILKRGKSPTYDLDE